MSWLFIFFILCVAAQGSKGIESKGVWAQRFQRLRLSSFSLNEISLREPEDSQHGQQKSCQTVCHTSATKGSWGYWPTTDDKNIFQYPHQSFLSDNQSVTRKKKHNKSKYRERNLCVWQCHGPGAQEDHTWRQEEDTEKREAGEKEGKERERDRKIRSEIQKHKSERLLETELRNKKGSLS